MINQIEQIIRNSPELIPAYLFMIFMLGILGWEILKLIIYVIRNSGKSKK
jgi:hypothetical protein